MSSGKEISYVNSELRTKGYNFFEEMKRKKEFCDITFVVGQLSISAHRIIIAAAIPRILEMYPDGTIKSEGQNISLVEINPTALEILIEYAYTCTININASNVIYLLIGACHLNVQEVREACCDFMTEILSPGLALDFMDLAQTLYCTDLVRICERYIEENLSEVSQTVEFLTRSSSYVRDLIVRDELQVPNEAKVYEAVINWVKYSPKERKADLPDMLKIVRMPLFGITYLTEHVAKEELIMSSTPCRDLMEKAKDYPYVPTRREDFRTFPTHARRYNKSSEEDQNDKDDIYAISAELSFKIHHLDSKSNKWRIRDHATFPSHSRHYKKSSEEDEGDIYAISAELSFQIQHLDTKSNKWCIRDHATFRICDSPVVAMCDKIYLFDWENIGCYSPTEGDVRLSNRLTRGKAYCVQNNKLYVFGGSDGYSVWNTVELFDPESEEWTKVSSMREGRSYASATALGEYVYVLGGSNTRSVLKAVERYHCETGEWSTVAAMLTQRHMFGSATLNGKIYACGGSTSVLAPRCISTAEMYDPASNQWNYISPMHSAGCFLTLVSCGGKLYTIGGQDDEGNHLSSVEVYDPYSDGGWSSGYSLNASFVISGATAFPRLVRRMKTTRLPLQGRR